ncbi:MAG: usg protein [Devosiaceae bacterium]|nr:usg protein [Devosiaceae bacterium MH13]
MTTASFPDGAGPTPQTRGEEMELMLKGYGLITANILYRMPDHPSLLQTFIWQAYDQAPKFPKLGEFLDFWKAELDGPLHSVQVAHRQLISPGVWRKVDGEFPLH